MALHWWRTNRLVHDLARDSVSELDASRYMMVAAVLYITALYQALWFGAFRDWAFFLEIVVVTGISLIGVHECFKANGGSDGEHFLARFCSLAVPVGVKLALLGVFLGQGIYYAAPYLLQTTTFRDPGVVYRYISFAMPVGFTFVYYWRVAFHLGRVRAMYQKGL